MNRTLFDCGFKKEVELKNGKLYDVTATLPEAVQKQTYDFKCGICIQIFFRRQHLEMHIKFKHPAKPDLQNGHSVGQSGSSAASTSHNSFVDLCLQGNSQPEEGITPQAAQAHYLWVRASEVIWSEYTRIISVLSDAK